MQKLTKSNRTELIAQSWKNPNSGSLFESDFPPSPAKIQSMSDYEISRCVRAFNSTVGYFCSDDPVHGCK